MKTSSHFDSTLGSCASQGLFPLSLTIYTNRCYFYFHVTHGETEVHPHNTASAQQGPGLALRYVGAQVPMPLEPAWGLLVAMKRGEGSALAEAPPGCGKKHTYPVGCARARRRWRSPARSQAIGVLIYGTGRVVQENQLPVHHSEAG